MTMSWGREAFSSPPEGAMERDPMTEHGKTSGVTEGLAMTKELRRLDDLFHDTLKDI
jgi:hypothetical protein